MSHSSECKANPQRPSEPQNKILYLFDIIFCLDDSKIESNIGICADGGVTKMCLNDLEH